MLSFVEVEGYRCFPKFRMDGLARVNLLVGKNNCGKTCLLEAVQLLASGGSLDVLAKIAEGRGEFLLSGDEEGGRPYRSYPTVRHFFYGRESEPRASFGLRADNNLSGIVFRVQSLEETADQKRFPFEASEGFPPTSVLVLETQRIGELEDRLVAVISEEGSLMSLEGRPGVPGYPLSRTHAESTQLRPVQFVAPDSLQTRLMSGMWNQVLVEGRESEVIEAMRILDPEIENIVFLSGGVPYFPTKGGVLVGFRDSDRRVPLGSLGDGVRRLLALALSLVRAKGGILLIDEIDTGLHYSVMGDMWRLLIQGARQADIQVFAATHSDDCVRGLAWACEHDPESAHDVSLQKIHSDLNESVALDAEGIILAVAQGVETR